MANSSPRSVFKCLCLPFSWAICERVSKQIQRQENTKKETAIPGTIKGKTETIYKNLVESRLCELWNLRFGSLTCVPQHLTCPWPSLLAVNQNPIRLPPVGHCSSTVFTLSRGSIRCLICREAECQQVRPRLQSPAREGEMKLKGGERVRIRGSEGKRSLFSFPSILFSDVPFLLKPHPASPHLSLLHLLSSSFLLTSNPSS